MRNHDYWVYILTNKQGTTLYIGITNNIVRRLSQHRSGEVEGFTKRYHLNRLVWLEHFRTEIALIEQTNPRWLDLSDDWEQQPKLYDRAWDTAEMI